MGIFCFFIGHKFHFRTLCGFPIECFCIRCGKQNPGEMKRAYKIMSHLLDEKRKGDLI